MKKLEELKPLNLSDISDFDEMLTAMSKTSFGGRCLGEASNVLYQMYSKPSFRVLTISGAMTIAKMSLIISEMIERNLVDIIVTTGALITHSLTEAMGLSHYKCDMKTVNDSELYEKGYNRIYDSLESDRSEEVWNEILIDAIRSFIENCSSYNLADKYFHMGSKDITFYLGKCLDGSSNRSILKSAYNCGVPIYIPAFTDSELCLQLKPINNLRKRNGLPELRYDGMFDLDDYTFEIMSSVNKNIPLGIFTIGGGVPRNWAQQVGPYLDTINREKKLEGQSYAKPAFKYGVRICPDLPNYGHLSGCTYSEGQSWGKFCSDKKGAMLAEVMCDATLVWPLLMKGVFQRLDKNK